ncbi:unnamed protein product [Gordionus sp. m RMFG-2023]|uniref:uncharacterized protein LOC135929544 isoform X2 n=1 Tax=Gordionus sp. m RMFG-2023 TaxID=3053472 RepID=UPI0030DF3103
MINSLGEINENIKIDIYKPESWHEILRLQHMYSQYIINYLEYALENQLEKKLWKLLFEKYIEMFFEEMVECKKTQQVLISNLNLFLDMSFGFFNLMLHQVFMNYNVEFPLLRNNNSYGLLSTNLISEEIKNNINKPSKDTIIHMTQSCIQCLADITYYKGHFEHASFLFLNSYIVNPKNGYPFFRVALINPKIEDLCTRSLYYFIRALGSEIPYVEAEFYVNNKFEELLKDHDTLTLKNDSITPFKDFLEIYLATIGLAVLLKSDSSQHLISNNMKSYGKYLCHYIKNGLLTKSQLMMLYAIMIYFHDNILKDKDIGKVVASDSFSIHSILFNFIENLCKVMVNSSGNMVHSPITPLIHVFLKWLNKSNNRKIFVNLKTFRQDEYNFWRLLKITKTNLKKYIKRIWPNIQREYKRLGFSSELFDQICNSGMLPEDYSFWGFVPLRSDDHEMASKIEYWNLKPVHRQFQSYVRSLRMIHLLDSAFKFCLIEDIDTTIVELDEFPITFHLPTVPIRNKIENLVHKLALKKSLYFDNALSYQIINQASNPINENILTKEGEVPQQNLVYNHGKCFDARNSIDSMKYEDLPCSNLNNMFKDILLSDHLAPNGAIFNENDIVSKPSEQLYTDFNSQNLPDNGSKNIWDMCFDLDINNTKLNAELDSKWKLDFDLPKSYPSFLDLSMDKSMKINGNLEMFKDLDDLDVVVNSNGYDKNFSTYLDDEAK